MADKKSDAALAQEEAEAIEKAEAEVAARKDALRMRLVGQINDTVAQLKRMGFEYTVLEGGAQPKKKIGRPRNPVAV
jgi:L,D-peptidoglycan transpeptidase YkuD (ErfK/YbiS/YcfS/YnhG family)